MAFHSKFSLSCKFCSCTCKRNGIAYGNQRWKCKTCGKTQFRQYKRSVFNAKREQALLRLNAEGVGIRSMARLLGYSPTHILRLLCQLATSVRKPIYQQCNQDYEVDELWTYAGSKRNECWLIWVINRKAKHVIDFIVGRRTKENVRAIIFRL